MKKEVKREGSRRSGFEAWVFEDQKIASADGDANAALGKGLGGLQGEKCDPALKPDIVAGNSPGTFVLRVDGCGEAAPLRAAHPPQASSRVTDFSHRKPETQATPQLVFESIRQRQGGREA